MLHDDVRTYVLVPATFTHAQRYNVYDEGIFAPEVIDLLWRMDLCAIVLLLALTFIVSIGVAQNDSATQLLSFNVSYGGRVYDSALNQTSFSYVVVGVDQSPDLSHFDVGIPSCTPPLLVVETVPSEAVSFGTDPTTGVSGMKWDLPLSTSASRTYSIAFLGNVAEGDVQVAVKAGNGFEIASLPGPSCQTASIDVDKFVSNDGVTWDNADDAPGPEYQAGDQVSFRFVITNVGNVEVTGIGLTDSMFDTSGCTWPAALPVGAFAECTIGPFAVEDGQHTNIATASAAYEGVTITTSDEAHYFSGNLPEITIEKQISKNGGSTWADTIRVGRVRDVVYKLAMTNTGNVPLTNLTLVDDTYSTASCILPVELAPGASYECVIGPFPTGEDDYTNTATASGEYEGQTVSDTDTASYRVTSDDTSGVVIIIEGPVDEININIITIFGLDIEIDANDPVLTSIRIGDIIRVEGDLLEGSTTIVIVAVTVVIVDIDIILVGAPSGPIFVPIGCKISGNGRGSFKLKCSGKGSGSGRGSGSSRRSS
ncbi:MAG: hypothetical protein IPM16_16220 [Chloroflexi bacterium]|nr:hypothetical protein [Chloroflexota bacterium]